MVTVFLHKTKKCKTALYTKSPVIHWVQVTAQLILSCVLDWNCQCQSATQLRKAKMEKIGGVIGEGGDKDCRQATREADG